MARPGFVSFCRAHRRQIDSSSYAASVQSARRAAGNHHPVNREYYDWWPMVRNSAQGFRSFGEAVSAWLLGTCCWPLSALTQKTVPCCYMLPVVFSSDWKVNAWCCALHKVHTSIRGRFWASTACAPQPVVTIGSSTIRGQGLSVCSTRDIRIQLRASYEVLLCTRVVVRAPHACQHVLESERKKEGKKKGKLSVSRGGRAANHAVLPTRGRPSR